MPPKRQQKKGGKKHHNKRQQKHGSPHKKTQSHSQSQSQSPSKAQPSRPEPQLQQSNVEQAPSSNEPSVQLKNKGNEEFQKSNFGGAIEYYSKSLELDGTNHAVFANRSAAFMQLKKYEEALSDADRCIELQPKWGKGYVRKANVLSLLKEFDNATELLKKGLHNCDDKQLLHKALNDLDIKRINTLDKNDKIVGGHHEQADKFRKLINWLLDGGAKFPQLYLKFYSPEFRAIHAMDRVAKDEDICYIPHDYIMTSDVAKASELGKAIITSKIELRSKHSYLASYLLTEREKGDESKWFIYLSILPRKFETIPLFFDAEYRGMLQGSISLRKIDDRLDSLRTEYENICGVVPTFKRFTLDDFIWARLVVITRIFGLVIDGVKTDGLVPMADMLNHRRPRETKWTYDQNRRGFVITTLQTIKKDAEIFDSYGRKCNSRFFVNYGFSLEENLDNEAMMSFELQKNDPQHAIKARQLGFNPEEHVYREFQIPMQYKEKKVKECFSWLRVAHAQGNEFLIISSDGLRMDDLPPLSIRNETSVLTSLAVAATKSLKKFTSPLEDDNELLADEEKHPKYTNIRNLLLMRRGEKQVLTFYVNLLRQVTPLFKMNPKDLKLKLRKEKRWKNQDDPVVQYVINVVVPLASRHRF